LRGKRELAIYLDSSAIVVKRYIEELGSNVVRELYLKAYSGEVLLSSSIWNVGEVSGAFDRLQLRDPYQRLGNEILRSLRS